MVANKTFVFKSVPVAAPIPGKDILTEERTFDLEAPAPAGGFTAEVLAASFDPYLRGRLRDPKIQSYASAFELDGPISNHVVARVLKSDNATYAVGALVIGILPIAEYIAVPAALIAPASVRVLQNPYGLPVDNFLGPLGMPGLTAYSALHEIGQPKAGETIFVSSAAGAVGQLVGQIAKRLGLRTIGSVGSDEKLRLITEELGYDAGFNYKKESPIDALKRLAPEGVDIYFENVGGDHLEAAIQNMNQHGRIAVCGMIADYNKTEGEERTAIRNAMRLVVKRIKVQGFIVSDANFGPKYFMEHQTNVQKWLHDGSLKAQLSVTEGIDNAAEGLAGMLEGRNFGKALLHIKD